MVHKMDGSVKDSSSAKAGPNFQRRMSAGLTINTIQPNPVITLDDSRCVMDSINNAISYRKTDCESIDEILKYCGSNPSSPQILDSPHLGVRELELGSGLHIPGNVPHMPPLRSPRLIYSDKSPDQGQEKSHFHFPAKSYSEKRHRTKRRTQRTNTTPVLSRAAKNCFLLGAFSKDYSVESVTSSLLKDDQEKGEMFMSTHTVVILGELSVGKSALCKKFFRTGMNSAESKKSQKGQTKYEDEEDEEFVESYMNDQDEETPRSDSHHIYERPIDVDGHCTRIRILDINAEKHRMECEDFGDFEPYLETGDAYVLAYAVTDKGTFKTVAEILSRMARFHPERMAALPVIVVGNKCDLVRRRQVATTDGVRLAEKHKAKFIETSASLNQNVTELFEGVIHQIRLRQNCEENQQQSGQTGYQSSSHALRTGKEYDSSLKHRQSSAVDIPHRQTSSNHSSPKRSSTTEASSSHSHSDSHSFRERPKFKKSLSQCLVKIMNRKDKNAKLRSSGSCQDLSVL